MTDRFAHLERARDEVLAEAESFRLELEPILAASLRAGMERLTSTHAAHLASLDGTSRRALRETCERAIASSVGSVSARLRDPELWLSPRTAPDLLAPTEPGWSLSTPAWLARLLGRGERRPAGLGALDDPGNRIWVAIASAAGPLDAVLHEFGFAPQRHRIGGGRFGVAPRTLPRLDPSGALQRRWKRYRAAYERYEALARVRG
ncbi:MAG TPA: hypothetical protein VFK59_03890 [Actinomycetota bacterium]|nr:hypothetical protein [Actinomycetota bacterium]